MSSIICRGVVVLISFTVSSLCFWHNNLVGGIINIVLGILNFWFVSQDMFARRELRTKALFYQIINKCIEDKMNENTDN